MKKSLQHNCSPLDVYLRGEFVISILDRESILNEVEQRAIIGRLEALSAETGWLEEIYQSKLESLEELKKSVLGKAFEGEL